MYLEGYLPRRMQKHAGRMGPLVSTSEEPGPEVGPLVSSLGPRRAQADDRSAKPTSHSTPAGSLDGRALHLTFGTVGTDMFFLAEFSLTVEMNQGTNHTSGMLRKCARSASEAFRGRRQ